MANLSSCTEAQYVSKWATFTASAIIQACAGLSYSFSVYAPTIKDTLGLTQTQIATVGSAVNLGGYFAIVSGSVYDNLKDHHRLGPRLVLWMGCLCCFCGYTGLYLMASGKAPNNFPQLLVFAIAAGNSGTYFDTTTLVTNVRNFPNERGFVVGVLKSFLGLSSSIYTSIYVAFFEPDAVAFLLMLALAPTLIAALLSAGLNYVPFVEASEAHQQQQQHQHAGGSSGSSSSRWGTTQGRFLSSFLLVGVLALYQMASAVLVGQHELSSDGKAAMVAGMLVLLALAAGLPLRCGSWHAEYGHPYIGTQESHADDGDDGEHSRIAEEPGSPQPVQYREDGRTSPILHHGHGTAHHRAVGSSSSSTSSSRPGTAVSISQAATAVSAHRKSFSSVARTGVNGSSSSSRLSSSSAGRKEPKQLLLQADDPAAEASPLLTPPGAHSPASAPADKLAPGRPMGAPGGGPGAAGGCAGHLAMRSLATSQMLASLDFWLLFVQFTVASGVCLAYLNNLGQLVVSLGGGHDGQVVFVSLFSVANAAGRLLMGYIPEQHLHARGTPRTLFLALTAAVTAAAALAVAYADLGHLYVLSVLLGVAFGAHWSLLPAITSDLFGLKHFAANYTTLQFAPAMGSYLLATEVTGWLYDRAAEAHGDIHQCIGPDCFRTAFLLLAGLAALSSLACCLATSRSRRAYVALAMHLKQVDIAEGGHGTVMQEDP
ncbi:hypothetical protein OEZ85_010161 [Tetradesmus obliquus]|uniref:Nodulin-like domain-containing protein n=1 Tax=Tetradesmus obliquus TaxID=3088 RepID=A0ABY8TR66_TETOB|nr:hypothetical protein OEZ85_010161 [Tetradesmus obliquus]